MSGIRSVLHRRLSCFVDWLWPSEQDEREELETSIRTQAEEIRGRIKGQAQTDGLTVRSTPGSGSFAKKTGLRRHMLRESGVEGLDIDLPFVVSPETKEGEQLASLLDRFERYAKASYPDTERARTKSSIELSFKSTKRSYDLVPMLATADDERQILIRDTGERIDTSVQKHVEFVRSRTRSSNDRPGRVKFNECVRLVKWWRTFRQEDSSLKVPSIVIDLLCADAYDAASVTETYHDTLAGWFGYMAHRVRERKRIAFSDFGPIPSSDSGAAWQVLDPVNPDNNIVARWAGYEIDELAKWLETARDIWPRAIRSDEQGKDAESLQHLVELFGNPIKRHCGE